MWLVVVVILVVIVIAAFAVSRGQYYRRMFSEGSFREFHSALSQAIDSAEAQGPNHQPRLEDKTAFVTEAGLGVGVTFDSDDDRSHTLHISFSQPGRHTTHAVSSRFGFFALTMLRDNKAELVPYFTQSDTHHMRFTFQSPELIVQDFDSCYSRYLHEYRPVPFQYEELDSE